MTIDAAIRHSIARYSASKLGPKKEYASIDEFWKQNPDCCRVYRAGHPFLGPVWVRIFGFYIVMVEVWFRANNFNWTANFYDSYVSFDACGRIVNTAGILESHGRLVPAGKRWSAHSD